MLCDRKEAKAHGAEAAGGAMAKRLLGQTPQPSARFIMVDDVLTDGATKREAVELLAHFIPDGSVPALVIAMDRQEVRADGTDAVASFASDTGVPVIPVIHLTGALDHLRARGLVDDRDVHVLSRTTGASTAPKRRGRGPTWRARATRLRLDRHTLPIALLRNPCFRLQASTIERLTL